MTDQTPFPMESTPGATPLRWRDGLAPAALGWIGARIVIAFGYLAARALESRISPPTGTDPLGEGLFAWDGTFYRMLSTEWYTTARPDAARFFPLYPGAARLVAPVVGGSEELALLLISNLCAFGGAVVLWRLAREVLGDRGVATRSAWMVAIFPAGFVFAFAYTEGPALLAVAATLLALHRRAFAAAGAFGLLAAMLRPVGGLVLVAILVELWRASPRPKPWIVVVAITGPIAGLAGSLAWIARSTGDLWLPITEQGRIRGGFQDPVTRVLEPIGEMLRGNFADTANLVFMLLFVALLVVAVQRGQPPAWLAYAAASMLVTYAAQVTDSVARYGMVTVPLIVALAQWADRRWRQTLVAGLGATGLLWLTIAAWLGRITP